MRHRITTLSVGAVRALKLEKFLLDTPRGLISTKEWFDLHKGQAGVRFLPLFPEQKIEEKAPLVVGHSISRRFTEYYNRKSKEGFVAVIPQGRVFGEYSNLILTPDNYLLSDVSREFGAQGGRRPENFSILRSRWKMPEKQFLSGRVAVISTCGAANFHHWNYDVLPRLDLLKKAGLLDEIDHFIIHYTGSKFQQEGLSRLGIHRNKIINPVNQSLFYAEAEYLFVPSLTEDLGTISPFVLNFLNTTFLPASIERKINPTQKLYISRRNAPSRRIINETAVMEEIFKRGFTEFIPEEHTMAQTAEIFARASSLISVHGSGFSNLAFISPGAKVLDIMAPYHQDPYYWMISNQRSALYVALFAEGEHPPDDLDLVKRKVDDDLLIDLDKLRKALDLVG